MRVVNLYKEINVYIKKKSTKKLRQHAASAVHADRGSTYHRNKLLWFLLNFTRLLRCQVIVTIAKQLIKSRVLDKNTYCWELSWKYFRYHWPWNAYTILRIRYM